MQQSTPDLAQLRSFVGKLWIEAGVAPAYQSYLASICFPQLAEANGAGTLVRLPQIFCQLPAEEENQVAPVVAAWSLLRLAARLLDDVEDGHFAGTAHEQAVRLNGATGLIFSATAVLNRLTTCAIPPAAAADIRDEFTQVALETCSGQHLDLTETQPTLDTCWQIAQAKSGAFVGLLCWAGGRLGSADGAQLSRYREFGTLLGILDQIRDDLNDLWPEADGRSDLHDLQTWRLPLAYAFSVLPAEKQAELHDRLSAGRLDAAQASQALRMIVDSGAGIYLTTQSALYRQKGLQLIAEMGLPADRSHELTAILNQETLLAQYL